MNPPADWFRGAVVGGLQRLVALSLQGQPPAETIAATALVWVDTLWANKAWQEDDQARIDQAFKALCGAVDRWPSPKQLIEQLPARAALPALKRAAPTAQQRAEALAQIDELCQSLKMGGGHEPK